MLKNQKVSELIEHVTDKNLSKMVMDYVRERSLDEDSGCIQLLICKTSPFIQKMQGAIVNNRTIKGYKVFFEYLPTFNEVMDNGDDCEKKHPYCMIFL